MHCSDNRFWALLLGPTLEANERLPIHDKENVGWLLIAHLFERLNASIEMYVHGEGHRYRQENGAR
jgi:hypothetical protein